MLKPLIFGNSLKTNWEILSLKTDIQKQHHRSTNFNDFYLSYFFGVFCLLFFRYLHEKNEIYASNKYSISGNCPKIPIDPIRSFSSLFLQDYFVRFKHWCRCFISKLFKLTFFWTKSIRSPNKIISNWKVIFRKIGQSHLEIVEKCWTISKI